MKGLKDLILKQATELDIDWELIAAIIWQESRGDRWATRFEPAFYENKILPRTREQLAGFVPSYPALIVPSLITEKHDRSTSFGLMQIMGETARVVGFKGNFLSELLEPSINLIYGCKYLKRCLNLATSENNSGKIIHGLSVVGQATYHYNGGLDYPPIIQQHLQSKVYNNLFLDND